MTIAIGLLADDSYLLAADSQHSTMDYKFSQGKVYAASRILPTGEALTVAMTGASDSQYLQGMWDQIREQYAVADSLESFEAQASAAFEVFYRDHILPFAVFPDPADRPTIDLILVASCGFARQMWVSNRNLLSPASGYAAVGSGWTKARTELDRTYPNAFIRTHPEYAVMLAIYVLGQVKSSEPFCGKDTDVTCLRHGRIYQIPRILTAEIEHWCEKYVAFSPAFLWNALGFSSVAADVELAAFRTRFEPLVEQVRTCLGYPKISITSSIDQT